MTALETRPAFDGAVASPPRRDLRPLGRFEPARSAATEPSVATAIGTALFLLAVLLLGFAGYLFGLSGIQEERTQTTLYKTFRNQLALAVAPTGPQAVGEPVALIDIPQIGLRHAVVVEGTSGAALTRGPGHRVNSPLPGQAGVSVIYGRRVSFGAPLAHLDRLRVGDDITATTATGLARYQVTATGTADRPLHETAPNRLVLVTADASWRPDHPVSVSATLVGTPAVAPARPALPDSQKALAVDPGAVLVLMMWSLALAGVAVLATVARHRWAAMPAYVCAVPVGLAVVWNVYESAAQLLPNLY